MTLQTKFTNLISEYMQPWTSGNGKFPVDLTSSELIQFAQHFFTITIEVPEGDDTKIESITTDTVRDIMERLGFKRNITHSPFEGLTVVWRVSLNTNCSYEFK